MFFRKITVVAALLACTFGAPKAEARFWQCAPYARLISGVDIRGNALTWWSQAAGKFSRGATPRKGAVMAFAATGRMRMGHVATVSRVIGAREVLLTHANWSRPGAIETDVRAVDVSDAGDWSRVKVWFAGTGGLGTSSYPVDGFIYADGARDDMPRTQVLIASASPVAVVPTGHIDVMKRAAAFTLDLK